MAVPPCSARQQPRLRANGHKKAPQSRPGMNRPAGFVGFPSFIPSFRKSAFTRPPPAAAPRHHCIGVAPGSPVPYRGGDTICTFRHKSTASVLSSPAPKRLLRNRAGQSWSVCPRIFGGFKPFSRGQSPKNGFGTNQTGIPRFGPVWQDFLEKCKISCKIIEGRYSG